jgi:hypothetical protein
MSNTPKAIERWIETRKRGKWNYVLMHGVLAWGIPMFAVMTFVVNKREDRPLTPGMIAISAALWAVGGLCFGLAMWAVNERSYRKHLASQGENTPR